jgi:O-antigen/teichoic acid export membrane protein
MKENRKFYSSLGLLILLNAVIKPLWIFGIDREVQNTVGTAAYGAYFSLLNLSIVLSFLLDLGFTAYLNRHVAARDGTIRSSTSAFLLLKLAFSAVYLIILFAIAFLTGVERFDILLYVATTQVALSFFVFLRTIITANQWFGIDAWLSVLDKSTMIILCGGLLYLPWFAGGMTIERFLILQLCCTSVAAITALLMLFKMKANPFTQGRRMPSLSLLQGVLPFTLIYLLMSSHNRLDGFLLERLYPDGAHEAGLYAASFRLLDASNMIGYLVASFLLPFIARLWSEKKRVDAVILDSRHFMLSYSITIVCIAVFLAPWIQWVLYDHTDEKSAEILQWCMPALIGYSLSYVYGTVLMAIGNVKIFAYITLFSVALNIVLNLLLIPSLGAKGCCMAAFASQTAAGIACMLFATRRIKSSIHFRSLFTHILTGLAISGFLYVCNSWTSKWLLMIVSVLITATIIISTGLFDVRRLIREFRNR